MPEPQEPGKARSSHIPDAARDLASVSAQWLPVRSTGPSVPGRIRPLCQRTRARRRGRSDLFAIDRPTHLYAIWGQPVVHKLPLVDKPVLFMVGTRDRTAPGRTYAKPEDRDRLGQVAERARELAPRMRKARVETFEDVGHLLHLERRNVSTPRCCASWPRRLAGNRVPAALFMTLRKHRTGRGSGRCEITDAKRLPLVETIAQ
jgi:pimeloyl-ACP methyl ester carboxylesterase